VDEYCDCAFAILTRVEITCILVGMKGIKDPDGSRRTIVNAAIRIVHRKGYGAASVSEILAGTGLTRGALYYHFPNKEALGHAILDAIEADLKSTWLGPLEGQNDPIAALQKVLGSACSRLTAEEMSLGCPLNNMAQELSCVEEGFRARIAGIYRLWTDGVAAVVCRGQQAKRFSRSVDPQAVATALVAGWTGARGLAKATKDSCALAESADQLMRYLESFTEIYDIIRVINAHAEAERWFAVMAIARDSHDVLWRHLEQLNPVARRAVETFHIGYGGKDPVVAAHCGVAPGGRGTETPGNPYRGPQ